MLDKTPSFYKKIFSDSPVGMCIYDSSGQCVEANTAICEIIGAEREQVLAQNYNHIESWKKSGLLGAAREATRKKIVTGREISVTSTFGKQLTAIANLLPLSIEGRDYLMLTFDDLSGQKKVESKLREKEDLIRKLLNNMTSGVAVYEVKGDAEDFIFKEFNKAAEKIEGFKKEELLGKSVAEVFPGVKKFGLWDVFVQVWKTDLPMNHPVSFYEDKRLKGWRENYVYKLPGGEIVALYEDATRRKQLEFEQQRLNAILETTIDMVSTATLEGEITYINTAGRKMLGLDKTGTNLEYIPQAHPKWAYEIVKSQGIPAAVEKGVWEGRTALITTDGREIPVSQVIMSHKSHHGEVEYLSTIVRDITEFKKIEDEITNANVLLNNLIDSIPDLIFYKDKSSVYMGCNNAFSRFVGREKKDIVGYTDYDLFESELAGFFREKDRQMLQLGIPRRNEEWVTYPDGRRVLLDTLKTPYYGPDNQVLGLIGVSRDITDDKKVEHQLLRQASAIDNAAEEIVITSPDGTIEYVNPAFERITGYSSTEVIGQNPRILKSGRQDDRFYKKMWETITRGRSWFGNLINRRKDGALIEMEATISPILDENKKILGYVSVKRDISDQIRLEKQLRESQKLEAIGTLAGGIAHDFNNILSAILGYTDLAMENLSEESDIFADLLMVQKAGTRARELVKQILTFSRQSEQELTPQRVQTICREAIKLLRATIPTTIEIRQDIDSKCDPVMANPTQIHQVIMNLCTNAYHAMRDNGGVLQINLEEITISSDTMPTMPPIGPVLPSGRYLKLEIKDTGVGMDPKILSRIFEPYFTTKEKGEGTGLGLSVVHGIIEGHSGKITAYSQRGHGTTFHVYIPVIDSKIERESAYQQKAPRGNERVLFVDDEKPILHMGIRTLERLGYQVLGYQDSTDAWEYFRQNSESIDLVITDMTMPKMTGAELAQKILSEKPDFPIIICSGFSETMNESAAKALGIQSFLMKPVYKHDLAIAIRGLLDKKNS